MCGIYTTENPSVNDIPLRTKSFKNISCHELVPFEEACKKVCILGTLSYNELEPSTLCYHMPSGIEIKVSKHLIRRFIPISKIFITSGLVTVYKRVSVSDSISFPKFV